jgi:hypothetical protein
MKKHIPIIILCVLVTSCITEKKVNRWLDEHKTKAAGYCADNYPPDTLTKTIIENIDSAGYYDAYMGMSTYADILFWRLDSMKRNATPERPYKVNMDSLRRVVDKEIRQRLKPCIDTVKVVTNTVVDMARVKYLQGTIDMKDHAMAEMQVMANERENKIRSQRKWFWLFWVLIIIIGGYTFLKLRFKLPI